MHRDETCRFARLDPSHVCTNEDGRPLRPGSACWYETRAQVRGEHRITDGFDLDDAYDAKRERAQ